MAMHRRASVEKLDERIATPLDPATVIEGIT
jgi:hypothetical protein